MIISNQTKIRDIISESAMLEGVLFRFGINQVNNQSVEEASRSHQENPDFVTAILKAFDENSDFPRQELASFSLFSLLNYLRKTHEYYLSKKLPEIEQSLNNLLSDYTDSDPLLTSLSRFFMTYKRALTKHISDEEDLLFPYIEYMLKLKQHGPLLIKPLEKLKGYSIHSFILHHDEVEKDLMEVKKIIVKYSPELSTSMPYRIFLIQLDLFEKDLLRHAMVEDEVLVPKALWLQSVLFNY
jgi:regulator of cell morphogenesis and NO signaling